MKKYSLYSTTVESAEREALLSKYTQAATYLPFYLFAQTHEQAFGVPAVGGVDWSQHRLVDTEEDKSSDTDLTFAEFDAMSDALLAQEHQGIELICRIRSL